MKKILLLLIFLCLIAMALLLLNKFDRMMDLPSVHSDIPKQFYRAEKWEIKYRFTFIGNYKPVEKYGKLSERFTGIKICVYNQQTCEFEEIGYDVSYGVDDRDRKNMIVVAIVPERIKDVTTGNIKYYMENYADGYHNKTNVGEVPVY